MGGRRKEEEGIKEVKDREGERMNRGREGRNKGKRYMPHPCAAWEGKILEGGKVSIQVFETLQNSRPGSYQVLRTIG